MSVSTSTQIQKTSDPSVFQRQCKILFEEVLKDPNVKEYGSPGQKQHGIDLLGRRRTIASDHWVGIQCKLTIKSAKLDKKVVRDEGTAALTVEPPLKELIIVTTAPDDTILDTEAAKFTDEQAKSGRDFTVQVWGWETLTAHILTYERTIDAFAPDAFPHLRSIQGSQQRLEMTLAGIGEQGEAIKRIEKILTVSLDAVHAPLPDGTDLNSVLDAQINQFRDLLNSGKAQTSLDLLKNFQANLPVAADKRIIFRVAANIAACKFRLGDHETAGKEYLSAFDVAPEEPKAPALKVLGLLLLDRESEAWSFGLEYLATTADQESLIAHMLQAAKRLPEIERPFDIIPTDLHMRPEILFVKIDYLRSQSKHEEWWSLAREAHKLGLVDPGHERFYAESIIDEACRSLENLSVENVSGSMKAQIGDAVAILENIWKTSLTSELPWDSVRGTLAGNLVTGLRILRRHEQAKGIVDLCLQHLPDDQSLITSRLQIALETGNEDDAVWSLDRLPISRDVIIGRSQVYANKSDWASLFDFLSPIDLSFLDPHDSALCECLLLVARTRLDKESAPRISATALLAKYADDPIVAIILYDLAVHAQDETWAEDLYGIARGLKRNLDSATRGMLVQIAERRDDSETIVELLQGRVDLSKDTDLLRSIARAYTNIATGPAAIKFVEELAAPIANLPFYARAIGSIRFNAGDMPKAEASFRHTIDSDPTDLAGHIWLIQTWLRQDKKAIAAEHLRLLTIGKLTGAPELKMQLAHLLSIADRQMEGLALGYETAVGFPKSSKVAQLYIGLCLSDRTGTSIPLATEEVGIDCCVTLERSNGAQMTVTIARGQESLPDHYLPSHSLSKLILGHKKGDVVQYKPEIGSVQDWKIVECKSKFLALLHRLMASFPARFPGAKGLHEFEIKDNDITPILDQVKSMAENDQTLLDLYLRQGFPLALISSIRGKSSIELASQISSMGEVIRTCGGSPAELNQAKRSISEFRERGIVLDAYAAWIVRQLELGAALRLTFGRVVTPQSTIDEILAWRQQFELSLGQPLETIGYANGKYFREEISAAQIESTIQSLGEAIADIRQNMEIVPSIAPPTLSPLETKILENAQHGVLDPIYVSRSERVLLVSEDLHLRNLGRELHSVESTWLQPVLIVALEAGAIDIAQYSKAIGALAGSRHRHISLNEAVLLTIAIHDESERLSALSAAASALFIEEAEPTSHLAVAKEFLKKIFQANMTHKQRSMAVEIVLNRVEEFHRKRGTLNDVIRELISDSPRASRLRKSVLSWARERSIPFS